MIAPSQRFLYTMSLFGRLAQLGRRALARGAIRKHTRRSLKPFTSPFLDD